MSEKNCLFEANLRHVPHQHAYPLKIALPLFAFLKNTNRVEIACRITRNSKRCHETNPHSRVGDLFKCQYSS